MLGNIALMETLLLIILAASFVYIVIIYNRFINLENRVREAWSGIDVQLKLRHDLVPNLVSIIKKYTEHEQDTLVEVVSKRTEQARIAASAQSVENSLSDSIKDLLLVVENYPELKADKHYLDLHNNLVKIEDSLQFARRYYNGSVRDYNIGIQTFPNVILANLLSKAEKSFFEIKSSMEKVNPNVSL